ncbi:MAG: aldehyde ferredoxin oxidoreductase family protein [Caldilineales bacterium]|nr:aldehyde ferredoxin oxidoreductase family protein [Caldilineales bacterium]
MSPAQTFSSAPAIHMPGYMGKILRVDLTTGRMWDEPLNAAYARDFIGGSGLGARYLSDFITAETDPLGPDNPLIFMTGPLVGTSTPAAGRFSVVARSPATGLTGEANSGGFWGPELKRTGYDGVIVTGQAEQPVWLEIREGRPPTLHEADKLWGLDMYATQDAIREIMDDKRVRVACIGLAGENQVLYAGVMNDHGRAAARTGLGAVMGSKKLKAVAVTGRAKPPIFDDGGNKDATREVTNFVIEDITAQMLRLGGTLMSMDVGPIVGDVSGYYYTTNELNGIEDHINAGQLSDALLKRHVPCFRCPIACGREVELPERVEGHIDGPEYETAVAFGPLIGSSSLEDATYAGHLCNLYGLDTISCGSTIAFAYYLFENGIIDESVTDGLELRWGDAKPALTLIEKIARREGFGELLAQGAARVGEALGVPELAIHANKLELPFHDVHAHSGQGLVYAVSTRGACHMAGDVYHWEQGREAPEIGCGYSYAHDESREKMEVTANIIDFRAFTNSAIICHFEEVPIPYFLKLWCSITGWDWRPEDISRAGERIYTLKRALNHRLGLTRANDTLPKPLLEAYETGPTAGYVPDLETLLDHYYSVRQWDAETGKPGIEKLLELGLDAWVFELWGHHAQDWAKAG